MNRNKTLKTVLRSRFFIPPGTKNEEQRTKNTRHSRAASGMTLLELLVVMVIMGIILSISVPAFTSMGRGAAMRGAVSSVRATLTQARQWAITHREQVTFCWDKKPTSGGTNPACYYVINADGVFLQATNELPLSVDFNGSSAVTFKTDGSLADGTTYTIVINKENSPVPVTKRITIAGLTGGVRVE